MVLEEIIFKFKIGDRIRSINKSDNSNNQDEWEVVEIIDNEHISILVHSCSLYVSSYLDVGKQYTLYRNVPTYIDNLFVYPIIWEIPVEQMKKNVARVLLYEWEDQNNIHLIL
jgi:hypothetical protein